MEAKKWVKLFFIITITTIVTTALTNYLVDPYGIYNTKILNIPKIRQDRKMRLIKAIKAAELKPKSIVLGTSRAETAFNPSHPYFIQPAYNLAVSSCSMYEAKFYFKKALEGKRLKKVLLALDYIMFNRLKQKQVTDFESYFNENPFLIKLKYAFSIDQLKDSIYTLLGIASGPLFLPNGVRKPGYGMENIIKKGLYLQNFIRNERGYYSGYPTNYTYKDTGRNSFLDFEYILKKCYENNIKLDIIFGPSHIRQWESLAYYLGYDKWLKWKKDVVIAVNKIAKLYGKKPFRVVDFAVYHPLTSEKIPTKPGIKMKYYRESSHYTQTLGNIVLDRLMGKAQQYKDFGVQLTLDNIDKHLQKLKEDRTKYINIKEYRKQVFKDEKSEDNI